MRITNENDGLIRPCLFDKTVSYQKRKGKTKTGRLGKPCSFFFFFFCSEKNRELNEIYWREHKLDKTEWNRWEKTKSPNWACRVGYVYWYNMCTSIGIHCGQRSCRQQPRKYKNITADGSTHHTTYSHTADSTSTRTAAHSSTQQQRSPREEASGEPVRHSTTAAETFPGLRVKYCHSLGR